MHIIDVFTPRLRSVSFQTLSEQTSHSLKRSLLNIDCVYIEKKIFRINVIIGERPKKLFLNIVLYAKPLNNIPAHRDCALLLLCTTVKNNLLTT